MLKQGMRTSTEQYKEFPILFYLVVFKQSTEGKYYLTLFNVILTCSFVLVYLLKTENIRVEVPSGSLHSHEFGVG